MDVTRILPSKNSECGKWFVLFIDMYSIKTRKLAFVQSKKIIVHTVACVCVCGAIQFFFFLFTVVPRLGVESELHLQPMSQLVSMPDP